MRVQRWLECGAHQRRPLFRAIDSTQIREVRMHPRAVQRATQRAGLATGYSSHSLRAGLATSADAHDHSSRAIQQQLGCGSERARVDNLYLALRRSTASRC